MYTRQPCPTLFPYTTLFRSGWGRRATAFARSFMKGASAAARALAISSDGSATAVDDRPISFAFAAERATSAPDRKSTRLNSSHLVISYAVFCLKKKNQRLRE